MAHYIPEGVLEPGEYAFTVLERKGKAFTKSRVSTNGNDMIFLVLDIEGRTVFTNLVFAPGAFWRVQNFMKAVCIPFDPKREFDLTPRDCVGKSGRCRLKIEMYNGKDKNEVDAWIPSPNWTPLGADAPSNLHPANAAPQPPVPGIPDDIPF